jgi:DNA repair protein RadD
MFEPRPDQIEVETRLREAIRDHQSVLVQCPTGWGKTFLAAIAARGASLKRKRAIFSVHRRQLIKQTAVTFDSIGVQYGYIAAGMPANPFAAVQIASIDTLRNRLDAWPADLLVVDEGHLAAAPTWKNVIDHYKAQGAKIIVLSATPHRKDGKPLRGVADFMVKGPSVRWCIDNDILSDYRAFAPVRPDMSGLHVRAGDYIHSELDAAFEEPQVIGDSITSWRRWAAGKRTIVFQYSRERGKTMCAAANSAGIPAVYIDGETDPDERYRRIMRFANGEAYWLIGVNLFTEGFDLSAQVGREVPIEAGIFNRPCASLAMARQMIGRVMRRKRDPAILLDHVNLMMQHGLPDAEIDWSLDGEVSGGKKSGEAAIAMCVCKKCFAMFRPTFKCPQCGAIREIDGREIKEIEGELAELDIEHMRALAVEDFERRQKSDMRRQEGMAKDMISLAKIAKERNYKIGWIKAKCMAKNIPFDWGRAQEAMR